MGAPGSYLSWLLPACLSHPPHISFLIFSSSSDFGCGLVFISSNITDAAEAWLQRMAWNGCRGASQARCSWRSKEPLGVGEWSYGGGSQALLTPLWLPLSGELSRDQVLWVAALLTQPN